MPAILCWQILLQQPAGLQTGLSSPTRLQSQCAQNVVEPDIEHVQCQVDFLTK